MDDIQFYDVLTSNEVATPQRGAATQPFPTPLPRQHSTPNTALFTSPTPGPTASQISIAPSVERGQSRSASQLNVRPNARGRTLNEDEVLVLFNCVLDLQEQYKGGKKSFWEAIEARFIVEAGHSYSWKSCKIKVDARVRQRKAYLEKYETGREYEATSPLDTAIDEWIEFLEEWQEEEIEESAQKTKDTLFQQQQVLYRDGLLKTMDKAAKRRAQSHQSSNIDESSNAEEDSDTNTELVRGGSHGARKKRRKTPTFKDFMTLHQESIKQEHLLIKSLMEPARNESQNALSQEIKNIGERVDKLEGDINQKFNMILAHLEKGPPRK